MSDAFRLRTVVRDPSFQSAWDALGLEPQESDEALEAVEWALARDPVVAGMRTLSEKVWAITVDLRFQPASATVYYVFDDHEVRLLDVIFPDR